MISRGRWWWLPIAAALLAAGSAEAASLRVVEEWADFVVVYDGDMPVLRYVRGKILAEGIPEDRRRGSYIHPLYSLDGRSLSDDFSEDHLHHLGLSWIWQKVSFDGVTKDLWTLRGIRRKCDSHQSVVDDDLGAVLKVANRLEDTIAALDANQDEQQDSADRHAAPQRRTLRRRGEDGSVRHPGHSQPGRGRVE